MTDHGQAWWLLLGVFIAWDLLEIRGFVVRAYRGEVRSRHVIGLAVCLTATLVCVLA